MEAGYITDLKILRNRKHSLKYLYKSKNYGVNICEGRK